MDVDRISMKVVIILFVAVLLLSGRLAVKKFKDQYPDVTVCESTMTDISTHYNMPEAYRYLKNSIGRLHNCSHIEGNVIIKNIWQDKDSNDFSFLSNIEEISGLLLIRNCSINQIILPKLKVIRGENGISIKRNTVNVSLYIHTPEGAHTKYAIFPELRAIMQGSALFYTDERLSYLPNSIKWEELFEDPVHQTLYPHVKNKNDSEVLPCNSSCKLKSPNGYRTYCWSADHCQHRTKCQKITSACKWCAFEEHEICCNSQCTAGCTKPVIKKTKCTACKGYMKDGECAVSCENERSKGNGNKKADTMFRVGRFCSKVCPVGMYEEGDACVHVCHLPNYRLSNGTCVKCNDPMLCGSKECRTDDFKRTDGLQFFITEEVLKNFTGCEHFIGQFHLTNYSFGLSGNVTVEMLYQHLNKVKVISGDVFINVGNEALHNLSFLQNVEEIRQYDTHGSLKIVSTPLDYIGPWKLRQVFGDVIIKTNVCYLDTLNWTRIMKNNKISIDVPSCNKTCHLQCGEHGCWGPTDTMCYRCIGMRAGSRCVAQCYDEPGYFNRSVRKRNTANSRLPYDDGECGKCHDLCLKNCSGSTPADCNGRCRYYEENNHCVRNCSRLFYPSNNKCLRCHNNCSRVEHGHPICTGGSPVLGQGGCSSCDQYIENENGTLQCYLKGFCPIGYYAHSWMKDTLPKVVCKKCRSPCKECKEVDNDMMCVVCSGFWAGNKCVEKCSPGIVGVDNPNMPNATCPECHEQCTNCTVPFSPDHCLRCSSFALYTDDNHSKFRCVSQCPITHNYSYFDRSIGKICFTRLEFEGQIRKDYSVINNKMLLIGLLILGTCIMIAAFMVLYQLYKRHKFHSSAYLKLLYSNIQEPDSRDMTFNDGAMLMKPNMNRLLMIPTTNLIFNISGKPLGTGAFGDVYQGIWKLKIDAFTAKDKNELEVAIKVLRINTVSSVEEFLQEAKVMASVRHKHCLQLIGVCLYHEKPCLVTAFMKEGSLDKYIKKHKTQLSSFIMLSWAEQIANGMAYLEMCGIIHRDLATRNVLVHDSRLVQITDFGLSKVLQGTEEGQQIKVTSGRVPVRWLALETLLEGIFSHKTDTWAYGITLWEIFTYGERPYGDSSFTQVIAFLRQNNRLMQPEICSMDIYMVMMECWQSDPKLRPSFKTLMTLFKKYTLNPTYYLNIPNDPCLMYARTQRSRYHSAYSYEMAQYSIPMGSGVQNYFHHNSSLDGTITTLLGDYGDMTSFQGEIKRHESGISYSSKKLLLENDNGIRTPLTFSSLVLSEEVEGYIEPIRPTDKADDGYLEPLNR